MATAKLRAPEPLGNAETSWHERFWEKVDKRGPDECWPWLACVNTTGHGNFGKWRGNTATTTCAHRIAYELLVGPIPVGTILRHRCDHPDCCNPAHLEPGTRGQNNTERAERGRNRLSEPPRRLVPRKKFPRGSWRQRLSVEERLLGSIVIVPETDCWVWQGSLDGPGYGVISIRGERAKTHRLSYETFVGPIPTGLGILHSCDNRACINPAHLRPGTNLDNTLDRYARGRSPVGKDHHFSKRLYPHRGEESGMAKLTTEAVIEIRTTDISTAEAMRKFGVSKGTICKARSGFGWKHISEASPVIGLRSGPAPSISLEDQKEIRRTNMPTREVMRRFGVSRSTALRAKGANY